MTARIKISQAGLAAGVAGKSRTDGLATGALVTLEDVGGAGAGASTFHLLDAPPEDTTAEASLAATGDLDVFTFSPTAASYGSYLIELRENGVPVERRILGIRTAINGLLIPAFNERASRHAALDNDGADQIDLSNNNADDFPTAALNTRRYAGWWRSWRELYDVVEAGTGGIADHAITNPKLAQMAANTAKVNPTAALANAQDLAVGANTVLGRVAGNIVAAALVDAQIDASAAIALSKLATQAANSIVVNPTTGAAAPTVVALGTNEILGRVAGNVAAIAIGANTVLGRVAGNIVSAALVNAQIDAAAAIALSKLATQVANSIVANATSGTALPTAVAAAADGVLQRVGSATLGFSVRRTGLANDTTFASIAAATTNISPSGSYSIPAGSSAVGDRYEWEAALRFVRGATATALNLEYFVDSMGMGTTPRTDLTTPTVAGTYAVYIRGALTITGLGTAGGGGTARCELSAYGPGATAQTSTDQFINATIDTTASISLAPIIRMGAGVAATTLSAWGGHINRVR